MRGKRKTSSPSGVTTEKINDFDRGDRVYYLGYGESHLIIYISNGFFNNLGKIELGQPNCNRFARAICLNLFNLSPNC